MPQDPERQPVPQKQPEVAQPIHAREKVPENPFLHRKLLIYEPFQIFSRGSKPSQSYDRVPAVFYIVEEDKGGGKNFCKIANRERGEVLGWVDRDECLAREWNTRLVFQPLSPDSSSSLSFYSSSEDALQKRNARNVTADNTFLFPILEVHDGEDGEKTFKVGRPLPPATVSGRFPMWVGEKDAEHKRLGRAGVLASEVELNRALSSLRLVREQLETRLEPEQRDSQTSQGHLLHLQKMNWSLVTGEQTLPLEEVTTAVNLVPIQTEAMKTTPAYLSGLERVDFEAWLANVAANETRLGTFVEFADNPAKARQQAGQEGSQDFERNMRDYHLYIQDDGKTEHQYFFVPLNELP